MRIEYYPKALKFLQDQDLNFSFQYLRKKETKEEAFLILKEALFTTSHDPTSQEIKAIISSLKAKYFPVHQQYLITQIDLIDNFLDSCYNKELKSALSKVEALLNVGSNWRETLIKKGIEISTVSGNKNNSPSKLVFYLEEQRELVQELIDRLKMLDEIKDYRIGLSFILFGEGKIQGSNSDVIYLANSWLPDMIKDIDSLKYPTHQDILKRIRQDFPDFDGLPDEPDLSFTKGVSNINKTSIDKALTYLFNQKYSLDIKEGSVNKKYTKRGYW